MENPTNKDGLCTYLLELASASPLSLSPFSIVRGRRFAIRRLVPGRPGSWLPMSSAGLQLVCVTCEAVWEREGLLAFGKSCSMTKPAEPSLYEQCRYTCKAEAATQFHRWHTVDGCCQYQRPPTSFRRLLVQAMSRNPRVKLSALLPSRPCS